MVLTALVLLARAAVAAQVVQGRRLRILMVLRRQLLRPLSLLRLLQEISLVALVVLQALRRQ